MVVQFLFVRWLQFGVSDTEGGVCLWQVGLGLGSVGMNKPYLVIYITKKTYQFKTLCKDDVMVSVH